MKQFLSYDYDLTTPLPGEHDIYVTYNKYDHKHDKHQSYDDGAEEDNQEYQREKSKHEQQPAKIHKPLTLHLNKAQSDQHKKGNDEIFYHIRQERPGSIKNIRKNELSS